MNRVELIQGIIISGKYTKYLEIGTFQGNSLLPLKCRLKIAVDPGFQIPFLKKIAWHILNPGNFRNKYFEDTSDGFFIHQKAWLEEVSPLDIVFIDGLHTFEQSLLDAVNALHYLNPDGLIILHDCYPPDAVTATPARSIGEARQLAGSAWKGQWCGDVWKTPYYLYNFEQESLDVCVLDMDYGLGVIRKKKSFTGPVRIDEGKVKMVKGMPYDFIASNKSGVNLKPESFARKLMDDPAASFA